MPLGKVVTLVIEDFDMEPGKDYVLIHNGPEAGRADGQGRGSAQLPVVDHRSHVPLHPHGFERLAERITLLARLRPDAGSGQRNTGLAGLRHGRRFPLPKQHYRLRAPGGSPISLRFVEF